MDGKTTTFAFSKGTLKVWVYNHSANPFIICINTKMVTKILDFIILLNYPWLGFQRSLKSTVVKIVVSHGRLLLR